MRPDIEKDGEVSHGMCAVCAKKEREKYEKVEDKD
jgi:hypothetical protein